MSFHMGETYWFFFSVCLSYPSQSLHVQLILHFTWEFLILCIHAYYEDSYIVTDNLSDYFFKELLSFLTLNVCICNSSFILEIPKNLLTN